MLIPDQRKVKSIKWHQFLDPGSKEINKKNKIEIMKLLSLKDREDLDLLVQIDKLKTNTVKKIHQSWVPWHSNKKVKKKSMFQFIKKSILINVMKNRAKEATNRKETTIDN